MLELLVIYIVVAVICAIAVGYFDLDDEYAAGIVVLWPPMLVFGTIFGILLALFWVLSLPVKLGRKLRRGQTDD